MLLAASFKCDSFRRKSIADGRYIFIETTYMEKPAFQKQKGKCCHSHSGCEISAKIYVQVSTTLISGIDGSTKLLIDLRTNIFTHDRRLAKQKGR